MPSCAKRAEPAQNGAGRRGAERLRSVFTALLDTCVLWPSLQRDFLLSLAAEGMYRPIWSEAILGELRWHEARKLVKRGADSVVAADRAERLIAEMRSAFDDAVVTGWEPLEGSYGLPDPDDEHVLAAAVVGGAGAIVTLNSKHFPEHKLPDGMQRLSPSEFAHNTVSLNPVVALRAVTTIAERSGRHGPSETAETILTVLVDRYDMAEAAQILREALLE